MSPAPPNAGGDLFAANLTGALLALASSAFIGVSFIVKKKGFRRAGAAGARAGDHLFLLCRRRPKGGRRR
jgi:magnesium transporter